MDKYELIKNIENIAPLQTQENWDCSGWIVDCEEIIDVQKVMLVLTITQEAFEEALKKNCDMIISHHPLFQVPLEFKKIQMYCAHTNLDKASGGTTDTFIEALGLDIKFFEYDEFTRFVELKKAIPFNTLLNMVKKVSPHARYVKKNTPKSIKKIALCAGSGSEFVKDAENKKFDVFITGDVKYHTATDAQITIIDAGHFETEKPVLKKIKKLLNNKVDIIYATEKTPFNPI